VDGQNILLRERNCGQKTSWRIIVGTDKRRRDEIGSRETSYVSMNWTMCAEEMTSVCSSK
jgi:hypothetical protein